MKKLYFFTIAFLVIGLQNSFSDIKSSLPSGYYQARLTTSIPVIDGVGNDTCWNLVDWAPIDQVWIGSAVSATDFSGKFKVLWTSERLYILIEIIDDSLRLQAPNITDVFTNIYNFDCVEVFIDENNSRETNYTNTHKAFAYHLDTAGNVGNGSYNWERLDDHFKYKVKKVAAHTYDWEFEMKVFNDKFVYGGTNTPVSLTDGKLMGWSLAYNDNDMGTTRQNMFGSVYIPGNTDAQRNISYFNSSVFGKLKLLKPGEIDSSLLVNIQKLTDIFHCNAYYSNNTIKVSYSNPNNEDTNISMYDIFGREINKLSISKNSGFVEKELNVSKLAKGLYFVKVSSLQNQVTKKIIIR